MPEPDRAAAFECGRRLLGTEGPDRINAAYRADHWDAERPPPWAAERLIREAKRGAAYERAAAVATRQRVATWLTARERGQVDAAAGGALDLIHRDALRAIRGDLATGVASAALVSATLVRVSDIPALSALAQDFPGIPAVGLVAEANEPQALAAAMAFGQAGFGIVADVRSAAGWSALRNAFEPRCLPDAFVRGAIQELTGTDGDCAGSLCTRGWVRFLTAAFSPRIRSAKQLAATLNVCCSTLTSRFSRGGLPSPKRYVAFTRLVWAAHLAEAPGLSISAIADRLDASSPQSFARMVRALTGVTASDFRLRFDGEAMLSRFRAALVEPYRDNLRTFDPLRGAEQSGRHVHIESRYCQARG
jgi:AraC-like DNA-binding protein